MTPPFIRFNFPAPIVAALLVVAAVTALALGTAAAPPASAQVRQIALPAPGTCPVDTRFKKHDFRAMWIADRVA